MIGVCYQWVCKILDFDINSTTHCTILAMVELRRNVENVTRGKRLHEIGTAAEFDRITDGQIAGAAIVIFD